MDLSIVVPVYNEQESLPLLYQAVCESMSSLALAWELVLVDDGSRDDSPKLLEQLALQDPVHVRVILLRRNFGQTAAIIYQHHFPLQTKRGNGLANRLVKQAQAFLFVIDRNDDRNIHKYT